MLKDGADNFLACKEPIDGMWRCYTEGKYGQSIRDAPAFTKQHETKFYNCLFRDCPLYTFDAADEQRRVISVDLQ